MLVGIISLFPDMFSSIIRYGVVGRAIRKGLLSIEFWNPRKFSDNNQRNIDGYLYGGGSGMLMMVQPIRDAVHAAKNKIGNDAKVIYLSPQGRSFSKNVINEFFVDNTLKIILVCGRYRGVDERLIVSEVDEEWSIGNYILSGGELAAMVVIDAISRFIPGVLNSLSSANEDTFYNRGVLDAPNYTRPINFEGMFVPEILLSGNHDLIRQWRLKASLGRTWMKKPELLKQLVLTNEEKKLLFEFRSELLIKLLSDFN